jgi:hypothetical protein
MATFHDPHGLDGLALRDGADIRSPLLHALVDLYLQKPAHSVEEARHFTELTLRLLDRSDAATRAEVARRLAAYPATPESVMNRIAADLPASADSVAAAATAQPPVRSAHYPPTAGELTELFFAADAAERRLILLNLGFTPLAPAAALSPGTAAEAARLLEAAALEHRLDTFARGLESFLGIAPTTAYRIVHDPLGECIVVVAKVLAASPDALQRILLFLNPIIGRSVQRVYELATLFNEVDAEAARTLLAIWRSPEGVTRRGDRGSGALPDPRPRESTRQDQSRSRAQAAPRHPPQRRVQASGSE